MSETSKKVRVTAILMATPAAIFIALIYILGLPVSATYWLILGVGSAAFFPFIFMSLGRPIESRDSNDAAAHPLFSRKSRPQDNQVIR